MPFFIRISGISLYQIFIGKAVLLEVTGPVNVYRNEVAFQIGSDDPQRTIENFNGIHVVGVVKGMRCREKYSWIEILAGKPDHPHDIFLKLGPINILESVVDTEVNK